MQGNGKGSVLAVDSLDLAVLIVVDAEVDRLVVGEKVDIERAGPGHVDLGGDQPAALAVGGAAQAGAHGVGQVAHVEVPDLALARARQFDGLELDRGHGVFGEEGDGARREGGPRLTADGADDGGGRPGAVVEGRRLPASQFTAGVVLFLKAELDGNARGGGVEGIAMHGAPTTITRKGNCLAGDSLNHQFGQQAGGAADVGHGMVAQVVGEDRERVAAALQQGGHVIDVVEIGEGETAHRAATGEGAVDMQLVGRVGRDQERGAGDICRQIEARAEIAPVVFGAGVMVFAAPDPVCGGRESRMRLGGHDEISG